MDVLHGLKEQAVIEQDLELTVPASQPAPIDYASNKDTRTTANSADGNGNLTNEDGAESVATSLSNLKLVSDGIREADDEDIGLQGKNFQTAARDEQIAFLHELFPNATSEQITESLTRHRDNPQQCFDELLNLSFINEDAGDQVEPIAAAKGVDGFAVGEHSQKRKGRPKRNRRKREMDGHYSSDGASPSGRLAPRSNVWQQSSEDVEFIASRTQMSTAAAHSLYHENGANLSVTIRHLIDKEVEEHMEKVKNDEILHLQVQELKFDIKGVSERQLYGAILLAKRLPSAAKDLLEAMIMTTPERRPETKLVATYTPINLSDDDEKGQSRKGASTAFVPQDPTMLAGRAGLHSLAASQAFEQASMAYRRGRSDKNYGGVAAYYAAEGHEQRKKQKELISSAADSLVYSQSTASRLDLHGVTVADAVRIARSGVGAWWDGLGDRKYVVGGTGSGYHIITGVGTHSAQGIGRIGPAVTKMLMREGWKVNVHKGEVIVEGKVRR